MNIELLILLLVVAGFIALIALVIYAIRSEKDMSFYIISTVNSLTVVCLVLCIGFGVGRKDSTQEVKTSQTYQLIRTYASDNTEHYLIKEGNEIQYSYINENHSSITDRVKTKLSKVYYEAEDKNEIRVVVHKIVKKYSSKWLFAENDNQTTSYEYAFYIPSRKDMYVYKK